MTANECWPCFLWVQGQAGHEPIRIHSAHIAVLLVICCPVALANSCRAHCVMACKVLQTYNAFAVHPFKKGTFLFAQARQKPLVHCSCSLKLQVDLYLSCLAGRAHNPLYLMRKDSCIMELWTIVSSVWCGGGDSVGYHSGGISAINCFCNCTNARPLSGSPPDQ